MNLQFQTAMEIEIPTIKSGCKKIEGIIIFPFLRPGLSNKEIIFPRQR